MTLFESNMDMVQPELFSKVQGMGFGDHLHRLQITDWVVDERDDRFNGIHRNYAVRLDSNDNSMVYFSCTFNAFSGTYMINVNVEYQYPYSKYQNMPDLVAHAEGHNKPISVGELRTKLENNKYVGFPQDFIDHIINDIKKYLDEQREFWTDAFLKDEKFYVD